MEKRGVETMIQYGKFSINCTSKDKEERNIYLMFRRKMKKYLLNGEMELYRIPVIGEDYDFAHNMALKYGQQTEEELLSYDLPEFSISESEMLETDYSKKDFDIAAAYLVNFWYFAYTYGDRCTDDYIGNCCENPQWEENEPCMIQNKIYQIPSSEFSKKKYAQLMLGYAVGKEVRELLIENQLAVEEDFEVVTNKKGSTVCYQLKPKNIVTGFAKDNQMKLLDYCKNCGKECYESKGEPYFISQNTLQQLKGLNQTKEMTGGVLEPWYIVNKEVYTLLHKHYPRMQFIPIFQLEEAEFYYGKV